MKTLIRLTDTRVIERNFVLDDIEKIQGCMNEALFIVEDGDDPELAIACERLYPGRVWFNLGAKDA